jgi:hypothetical protein
VKGSVNSDSDPMPVGESPGESISKLLKGRVAETFRSRALNGRQISVIPTGY